MFIVADFGRNNASVSRLSKDVVAPYVHLLPTYTEDDSEDPFADRKTLLYFQGRVRRKDVSPCFLYLQTNWLMCVCASHSMTACDSLFAGR